MHYVYCIASESNPTRRYIGYTENLRQRMVDHNSGHNPATTGSKWKLKGYIAFETRMRALDFERYLKSGSGHGFARKRLW
jgi:predicted GIY-YIG superfamily endonuclease